MEPPPDEADVPTIQNGEPISVEAFLDTGVGTNEEASADYRRARHRDAGQRKRSSACSPRSVLLPVLVPATNFRSNSRSITQPEPLVSAFTALREAARRSADASNAAGSVDRAQYDFRDGDEAAVMVEPRVTPFTNEVP